MAKTLSCDICGTITGGGVNSFEMDEPFDDVEFHELQFFVKVENSDSLDGETDICLQCVKRIHSALESTIKSLRAQT